MKSLAKHLKKPFWFPNVPSFVLKLIFGEMSTVLLDGVQVSNQKITDLGFKFHKNNLEEALN
jgi:NAD dependent epimerase/dehydratase family enzyme